MHAALQAGLELWASTFDDSLSLSLPLHVRHWFGNLKTSLEEPVTRVPVLLIPVQVGPESTAAYTSVLESSAYGSETRRGRRTISVARSMPAQQELE